MSEITHWIKNVYICVSVLNCIFLLVCHHKMKKKREFVKGSLTSHQQWRFCSHVKHAPPPPNNSTNSSDWWSHHLYYFIIMFSIMKLALLLLFLAFVASHFLSGHHFNLCRSIVFQLLHSFQRYSRLFLPDCWLILIYFWHTKWYWEEH